MSTTEQIKIPRRQLLCRGWTDQKIAELLHDALEEHGDRLWLLDKVASIEETPEWQAWHRADKAVRFQRDFPAQALELFSRIPGDKLIEVVSGDCWQMDKDGIVEWSVFWPPKPQDTIDPNDPQIIVCRILDETYVYGRHGIEEVVPWRVVYGIHAKGGRVWPATTDEVREWCERNRDKFPFENPEGLIYEAID
jgi:hypothetical protein